MATSPKYLLLLLMVLIEGIPFQNYLISEMSFPQNAMLQNHIGKFKAEASLFVHSHFDIPTPIREQNRLLLNG